MAEFATPENLNLLFGGLFALSELLALTPLRSNSVFELAVSVLRALAPKGGQREN
jgi:hypothetical protein